VKDYVFHGANGEASLIDLFEGRRQLIVRHFMFGPDWDTGCPSCTAAAESCARGSAPSARTRDHVVARAVPTFAASAAEHEAAGTTGYVEGEQPIEQPGESFFLRDGAAVYHTYSAYARGAEAAVGGSSFFLDHTALGRQEAWEEPKGRADDPHGAVPNFAT
jgi:predicted dithiol-disulfide oxidoreductase (DUF899 family)